MPALVVRDLCKRFPQGITAAREVSFAVDPGERLVLLGPTGSGKTTVLRCIAGLETPDRGVVQIDGTDVTGYPPHRRGVAMVFPRPTLYPHLTTTENLHFGVRGTSPSDPLFIRIRDRFRLVPLLGRSPASLSTGEQQRLVVARAILRRPRVLLLDEPLTHLDPPLRDELLDLFVESATWSDAPIVYVTHDQSEALAIGHRVAVLHNGQVVQIDTPQRLYDHPCDVFVASFIGRPAMNLLPARIEPDGDGAELRLGRTAFSIARDDAGPREVLVGVRPEHVSIGAEPADLQGTVTDVRFQGDRWIVRLHCADIGRADRGNRMTIAAVHSSRVAVGTTLGLKLDRNRLHVFDAETGTRLDVGPIGHG